METTTVKTSKVERAVRSHRSTSAQRALLEDAIHRAEKRSVELSRLKVVRGADKAICEELDALESTLTVLRAPV